jgi:uncharacterized protein (TIGR00106 family)
MGCARKRPTGKIGWSARQELTRQNAIAPLKVLSLKKRRIVSIAEFSIHPVGTGTSVSRYVKRAIQVISKIEGLEYQVTPMATILEARDVRTILKAVEESHAALRSMGAKRISSTLRIDERLDKPRTMNDKTESVKD